MENETQEQQELQVRQKSKLHQVTPLSKYLAMTLFITLPFLGGYIGYMFAPEKVVEVERIVTREVEVESRDAASQNMSNDTDVGSDNSEVIDWADFDVPDIVNPYGSNQIRWTYNGNIFSALPAEKTYALFSIVDQQNNVIYSSIVGDGVSIDENTNSVVWGGDPAFGTVQDMYGELQNGERYRYMVTLGYSSAPGEEQAFKDLAAQHVSYSDWFVVNWTDSNTVFSPTSIKEGGMYGSFTATEVTKNTPYAAIVKFEGEVTLSGTIQIQEQGPGYDEAGLGDWTHSIAVSSKSAEQLPRMSDDTRMPWFVVANPNDFDWSSYHSGDEVAFTIDVYNYRYAATGVTNSAHLVELIPSGE